MDELKSQLLYELRAQLEPPRPVGKVPYGYRSLIGIKGGSFEGPRLRGSVDPTGGEWGLTRRDGTNTLDVRMTLKTEDEAWIYVQYRGMLRGEKEVLKAAMKGEADPADYYMRITPYYETGHEKYAWLNSIVAVGIGWMEPGDVVAYRVFEIL
jgi:hypothetical protein